MTRRLAFAILGLSTLSFSSSFLSSAAHASPAGAQAETLFREARKLLAEGKVADACSAFEASQKLDPTTSTLLNQASCREKNSQLATAWGLFMEAERDTRAASDDAGKKFHKVAVEHSGKLESRVSKLTINVLPASRVERMEILRDTDPLGEVEWNRALPIDGGTYRITVRAPGMTEWSTTVTVGVEGDVKVVDVPRLQALPSVAAGASSPSPGVAPARAAPDAVIGSAPGVSAPESPTHRTNVAPLALGGGAVLLLAGAVAFHVSGNSTYDQAKREPDPTRQDDLWHSANNKRYVAQGLLVAGVGCAGAAAWLYFRGKPIDGASTTAFVPIAGGDLAGLGLVGSY